MNIYIIDPLEEFAPLKRHLELEGNKFVNGSEIKDADLVISTKLRENVKGVEKDVPVVGGFSRYRDEALKMMGYIPSARRKEGDLVFTRWFDFNSSWHNQISVGIPLDRFMVGGLGPKIDSGYASRYIQSTTIFDRPGLSGLLEALRFIGWVSIEVSSEDGSVTQLYTWAHPIGMYNILEGVPGSLAEWFLNPFNVRLTESWVVSVLISRYPFPHSLEGDKIVLDGISTSTEKHYWLYGPEEFKRSLSSTSTVLGIATAWDKTLHGASDLLYSKLDRLRIENIQYRTDVFEVASRIWKRAKVGGLID